MSFGNLVNLENDYCSVCDAGANPMLENETGHRPLAYVKNQQIKELLQESEQQVWFVTEHV